MEITEIFKLCGGKEKWHEFYRACSDSISQFLNTTKLDTSEQSFEIMKTIFDQVLEDYGESWYRRSLGK